MTNRMSNRVLAIWYILVMAFGVSAATEKFGSPHPCKLESAGSCAVDGNIGTKVIFEDATVRVWNFTLGSGETTSMHRHYCGYHFLTVTSSTLEVWGEFGDQILTISPEVGEIIGFSIVNDDLVQTASSNPIRIPRTHAARNIGATTFNEILFESKLGCSGEDSPDIEL
jgi:hypothetical protein